MDSDLSLIEISGEDDSLLQQSPTLGPLVSTTTTTINDYFSCSPLQIPIPNLSAEPMDGGGNKENMDVNKSEVPKLSVEPKQMKRRKKGGGYNLRKSLAWDRAFFTEEGVLNSEELSMLSGTSENSCGEALSVIREEGSNSSYNHSKCTTNSKDLQVSGKFISPFGNKLGSKAGICPRPLTSSVWKKHENVKISTVATKESKLQKIPMPKSASSVSSMIKNTTLSASHLKHRQISEPATDVQKIVGLKSSFKKAKCSLNKAKPRHEHLSILPKTSAEHSQRNLGNSSLEIQSLTIPQSPLAGKDRSGLEVISGAEVPDTRVHLSDRQDGPMMAAGSVPRTTHIIGKNKQYQKIQTTKPSGLRMPSPSLGFFSQPEVSVARSVSQRNVQPQYIPESSIPGLRDSGELKTPCLPGRLPKMFDVTASGNTSTRKYSAPSALTPLSHATTKSDLNVNNVKRVEVDLSHNSKNHKALSGKHDPHVDDDKGNDKYAEDNKVETIACMEKSKPQEHSQLKSKHSSSMQVPCSSGTKIAIQHQHEENKLHISSVANHVFISESHSGDAIRYEQISVAAHNDNVRHIQDSDQPFRKQAKFINSTTAEANQESHEENCILKSKNSKQFTEFQISPACRGNEVVNSHALSHQECIGKENEGATPADHLTNKSLFGDAQRPISSKISLNPRTSVVHVKNPCADDLIDQSVEQLELHRCCLSGQQDSQHNTLMSTDDSAFLPESMCADNSQAKEVTKNVTCVVPVEIGICTSESNDSKLNIDLVSSSVENYECSFDKVLRHDTMLCNLVTALEYDASSCKKLDSFVQRVGDLIDQSGEQWELRSCCLAGQRDSQYNSGTSSDDSTLLLKSTCDENSHGKEDAKSAISVVPGRSVVCSSESNESQLSVALVACGLQVDGAAINEMAKRQTDEMPFEKYECFLDKNLKHDPKLNDQVSLEFDVASSKELGSFVQSCQTIKTSNVMAMQCEMINYVMVKEAMETSVDSSHGKGRSNEVNCGSLAAERTNCENTVDAGLTNQRCMANEDVGGSESVVNETNVEDALDRNPLASTTSDQYLNDCYKVSEEQLELPNAYLVEKLSHGAENILPNVADVKQLNVVYGFDMKSFNSLAEFPHSMNDEVGKMDDHLCVEDAPIGSVGIDMASPGLVISLGFDEASESKDQIGGLTSSCTEPCILIEESGLLVHEDHEGIAIDELKMNALPHPSEFKVPQNYNRPRGQLCHKLDNSGSLTWDNDAIAPHKESDSSANLDNTILKPPPTAVPFSDEWLAAIEAAGQDILTIKSGAVQNSPPDKCLPEPGPWSPVRRKNNEIGPFDCTKFTNTLQSD